jgi:short-subunit dehydrogenase
MTDLHSTLIIGAPGDIARTAARVLLERGFSVTLAARSQAQLHAATRELCFHGTVNSLIIDLCDRTAVERLALRIGSGPNPVRHLFIATDASHRAGNPGRSVTGGDLDRARTGSLFILTRAAALNMQHHAGGLIANIGAMRAGQSGKAESPLCCEARPQVLQGRNRQLASELAEHGIRVDTITPVNEAAEVPDCLLTGCIARANGPLRCGAEQRH